MSPLTDEQRAGADAVIRHFSAPSLVLPVAEGEGEVAPLSEREMMFLVRLELLFR